MSMTLWYSNNKPLFTNRKLSKQQKDMDESQMSVGKGKKPGWKGYMGYDSNYMTFQKGKTTEMIKKTSGCWEFGQEGGEQNR